MNAFKSAGNRCESIAECLHKCYHCIHWRLTIVWLFYSLLSLIYQNIWIKILLLFNGCFGVILCEIAVLLSRMMHRSFFVLVFWILIIKTLLVRLNVIKRWIYKNNKIKSCCYSIYKWFGFWLCKWRFVYAIFEF